MSIPKAILRSFLTVVIIFGLAAAGAGAAHARAEGCIPHGARMASAHGALRVFTVVDDSYREVRACWGVSGRPVDFGVARDPGEYGASESNTVMAVRGSCVAVQQHIVDGYGWDAHFLDVYDVRTRRTWSYGSSIDPQTDPAALSQGSTTIGPIAKVVLGARCSVAWINANMYGGATQVRKSDGSGRVRLAQETDVDLHSLTLSGTTLTWTANGVPCNASLRGGPRGAHSVPVGD